MSFCSAFEQKADHTPVLYLVFFPFDLHQSPLVQLCHFPVSLQVFIPDSEKNSPEDFSICCTDSPEKWQFRRKRALLYLENRL